MNKPLINRLKEASSNLAILYVEDERNIRENITSTLQQLFKKVVTASNGAEGLLAYFENKFDVVLTDISMPEVNGIIMSRTIKQNNPKQKIIIITAQQDIDYMLDAIKLNVDGFILKPMDKSEFFDTLLKVCQAVKDSKELERYQENLEELVVAKTEELRVVNAQLQELNLNLKAKVEEELAKSRQKDMMLIEQSRLSAMGELLSNIAHQWRQPLSVIAIAVQDIKMALEYDEVDAEYIDKLEGDCMKEVSFLSNTLDGFKRFFEPNDEKERFSVSETFNEMISLASLKLAEDSIKFQTNIDESLFVFGYKHEFYQSVLNIINNAKDALNKSEQPLKQITITAKAEDGKAKIAIHNNGPKIDEEITGKIFEPYFTTKHQAQGTGLGLYMTKMIIEQSMGGRIGVSNAEDGVCFIVELPESSSSSL